MVNWMELHEEWLIVQSTDSLETGWLPVIIFLFSAQKWNENADNHDKYEKVSTCIFIHIRRKLEL